MTNAFIACLQLFAVASTIRTRTAAEIGPKVGFGPWQLRRPRGHDGPVPSVRRSDGSDRGDDRERLTRQAAGCAARSVGLLLRRRLHLRAARVGLKVALPDGRPYVVFRESTCDQATSRDPVMLAVWFRLRAIPPGARVRRWLFERLCIVNTVLFAGCDGYLVKLWMVNPATSDYAGLYSWSSPASAERYGRYIAGVLRPLSQEASVGYQVFSEWTLEGYLAQATSAPT